MPDSTLTPQPALDELLALSSDLVVRCGPNGVFRYVSPAARRVVGWEPSDLVGCDGASMLHPDDAAALGQQPGGLWLPESPQPVLHRFRRPNGMYAWLETAVMVVRDAAGRVHEVVTASRDVTDRVEARRELEAVLHRLTETEALLRLSFENAPIGMALTDLDGRFLRVNAAFEELLGYGIAELSERTFRDITHPEDVPHQQEHMDEVRAGRTTRFQLDKRYVRRDGHLVWAQLSATVVRTPDNAPRYFVLQVLDVSDRHRHAERLQWLALHDPLTGLANRALLLDRLRLAVAHHKRHPDKLAVIFFDLDRFKSVNDRYGHDAGDRVLVAVAERLRHAVRAEDTVGRLAGDEFVVVCPELQPDIDPQAVAARLQKRLVTPIDMEGRTVSVGASFGVAEAGPDDSAEALLSRADQAMYAAKRRRGRRPAR